MSVRLSIAFISALPKYYPITYDTSKSMSLRGFFPILVEKSIY